MLGTLQFLVMSGRRIRACVLASFMRRLLGNIGVIELHSHSAHLPLLSGTTLNTLQLALSVALSRAHLVWSCRRRKHLGVNFVAFAGAQRTGTAGSSKTLFAADIHASISAGLRIQHISHEEWKVS